MENAHPGKQIITVGKQLYGAGFRILKETGETESLKWEQEGVKLLGLDCRRANPGRETSVRGICLGVPELCVRGREGRRGRARG